jgi:hypothetical protein
MDTLQDRTRNTSWTSMFAACRSEADVVRLANDYLATWLPSDFEQLPPECRLSAIANTDELAHAAVTFTQCELHAAPDTPAATTLAALTEVFIAAQARVRQLRSPRYDPSA